MTRARQISGVKFNGRNRLLERNRGGAGGGGAFRANAVHFDGAVGINKIDPIYSGVSAVGAFSVFLKFDDLSGTQFPFRFADLALIYIDGGLHLYYMDASPIAYGISFDIVDEWVHVLVSWDFDHPSNEKIVQICINGEIGALASPAVDEDGNASINWAPGGFQTIPYQGFVGDMAELWFDVTAFRDFTIEENRRKFISADGKPVSLGVDGSTPFGVVPAIYLNGAGNNFRLNSGMNGDFVLPSLDSCFSDYDPPPAVGFNAVQSQETTVLSSPPNTVFSGDTAITSGAVSLWWHFGSNEGVIFNGQRVSDTTGYDEIALIVAGNYFYFYGGSSQVNNFYVESDDLSAFSGWANILVSWDYATSTYQLYCNDTECRKEASDFFDGASTIVNSFEQMTFEVVEPDSIISEFWFAPGQFIDFSIEANRRKFRTAGGEPAALGSDGSTPTGTAPTVYLRNPAATYNVNSGSGADFQLPALAPALTSPSD